MMQWFNTYSSALQAIGSILQVVAAVFTLVVTIWLTRTSIKIADKQKQITEEMDLRSLQQDEQTSKKMCLLIYYQVREIEEFASSLNGNCNIQQLLKQFKEYDLDLGISHESLIKYLETNQYRRYLDLIKKTAELQNEIEVSDSIAYSRVTYIASNDTMAKANEVADKAREMRRILGNIAYEGKLVVP